MRIKHTVTAAASTAMLAFTIFACEETNKNMEVDYALL